MRVIILKQAADLQSLTSKLVGQKAGAAATLDRVRALNPHVDFARIEPGTVLLLPDSPDIKAGDKDTRSIGEDSFDDFAKQALEGLQATAERAQQAADAAAADRAAVTATLKTAVVKRQLESDPLLRKQLDEATEAAATEQKDFKEATKRVETLHEEVKNELAELGKLFR